MLRVSSPSTIPFSLFHAKSNEQITLNEIITTAWFFPCSRSSSTPTFIVFAIMIHDASHTHTLQGDDAGKKLKMHIKLKAYLGLRWRMFAFMTGNMFSQSMHFYVMLRIVFSHNMNEFQLAEEFNLRFFLRLRVFIARAFKVNYKEHGFHLTLMRRRERFEFLIYRPHYFVMAEVCRWSQALGKLNPASGLLLRSFYPATLINRLSFLPGALMSLYDSCTSRCRRRRRFFRLLLTPYDARLMDSCSQRNFLHRKTFVVYFRYNKINLCNVKAEKRLEDACMWTCEWWRVFGSAISHRRWKTLRAHE